MASFHAEHVVVDRRDLVFVYISNVKTNNHNHSIRIFY